MFRSSRTAALTARALSRQAIPEEPGTFTEVRHKRAIDLTDQDVIRLSRRPRYRMQDGEIIDTGDARLQASDWREVLSTYHTMDHLTAEYELECFRQVHGKRVHDLACDALDRLGMPVYVMLRLHLHELSYAEIADTFVVLPRFALVEVQSRPAWTPAPLHPVSR